MVAMFLVALSLILMAFSTSGDAEQKSTYENNSYYYKLDIPKEWANKYKVVEGQNKTIFQFKSKTKIEADIVTIIATSSKTWKPDPYNQKKFIQADRGIVYYYTKPLDQPFTGQEGKDYPKMVQQIDGMMK
ncbi:hypothetical protein LS684_02640 [Cytobacillus spongiae]|uniref:hypothetical protein n=1 Tax=Cytobacillus spongiae TaxID=2901381 RepID=UPI001F3E6FDB|nr:hypothetical protein [Cytobacillus spongiae]UII56403.1 hypothetical protein LS684_02640 [Cytobacillus spongiae]